METELSIAAAAIAERNAGALDTDECDQRHPAWDLLADHVRQFFERHAVPADEEVIAIATLMATTAMTEQWKHDEAERQNELAWTSRGAPPLRGETKADRCPQYGDYQEYLRHPVFQAVRAFTLKKPAKCQCGAKASEVRHLRYPLWGTFDLPSNLRPVCGECAGVFEAEDD
jgi:hypothetical protein